MPRDLGDFKVAVGFAGNQVVVGVRGMIDPLTAPTLDGVVRALIGQGHVDMVLDLSGVDSMDLAGIAVIRDAIDRLADSGHVLAVRSARAPVQAMLDRSGLSERVRVEVSDPNSAALGPEELEESRSLAFDGGTATVSEDLARIGAQSSSDVVDAALRLVTALADRTLENADGVSVTLERHGRMTTVAASNDTVLRMDGHQYETGEGPCLAAAAEGRWFHSESLAEETRWPTFAPLAFEQGINSILSSPLMTSDRPLGALNIYSTAEKAFGTHDQELAALFANQASGILAAAGFAGTEEQANRRFTDAMAARQTIARAQGVLMSRNRITAENAAATLHRSARSEDVTVLAYATRVLASIGNDTDPAT